MEKVNIIIDGQEISVSPDSTVLEAAKLLNIDIPTLCYLKKVNEIGACRMCLVDIKGAKQPQPACVYPVSEGLEVRTNTARLRTARKTNLELILSDHDRKCLSCARNKNCELQTLSEQFGVREIPYEGERNQHDVDDKSSAIVRDQDKCVLCRRCVSVCKDVQTVSVIDLSRRGQNTVVGCAFDKSLADVDCVNCGQCITACPVGALREKENTNNVWKALADPDKHVVVQVAPSIRTSIGEEFGLPIGEVVTGRLVNALRRLGFDSVLDTDFTADLTVMEEGMEFISRLNEGKNLPLITSCSPGWVKFCEHNYPEFIPNLSTAKSPQSMLGALIKSYYAEKKGVDPKNIVSISVMPCTAKKFEAGREELSNNGLADVDISITTRECAQMIKEAGIRFADLGDENFDDPFGDGTGAGVIFGATGGVMTAALRTVADVLSGEDLNEIEYEAVRGSEGIKEATLSIAGRDVKIAVVNGLGNAREIMERVKGGEKFDFIEIMACAGGCVTGGGQPIVSAGTAADIDVQGLRAAGLRGLDENATLRKAHENPVIKKLYDEFLGEPGGHKAHELLHTSYVERK